MQLTRRHTMKRACEFAMVRAKGTSEAGRFVVINLAALPADQAGQHSRFGIITTKRIGHAVMRNLLRRRMREILRAQGDPIAHGHAVVIIMRNRAALADYHQLEADFCKVLARQLHKQPACSNNSSSYPCGSTSASSASPCTS